LEIYCIVGDTNVDGIVVVVVLCVVEKCVLMTLLKSIVSKLTVTRYGDPFGNVFGICWRYSVDMWYVGSNDDDNDIIYGDDDVVVDGIVDYCGIVDNETIHWR
jgi:hypothetical protein